MYFYNPIFIIEANLMELLIFPIITYDFTA